MAKIPTHAPIVQGTIDGVGEDMGIENRPEGSDPGESGPQDPDHMGDPDVTPGHPIHSVPEQIDRMKARHEIDEAGRDKPDPFSTPNDPSVPPSPNLPKPPDEDEISSLERGDGQSQSQRQVSRGAAIER